MTCEPRVSTAVNAVTEAQTSAVMFSATIVCVFVLLPATVSANDTRRLTASLLIINVN